MIIFKNMNEEQLKGNRHTLAHLLAASVIELYPGAQNAIGPAIDDGFYQDFDIPEKVSEEDLPKIEAKMREILKTWNTSEKREVTVDEAKKQFSWNIYKSQLIEEFAEGGKTITFYTLGNFVDLCKGGHSENPVKDVLPDSFKLHRVAGAYWKGDEKNKMLTRIYGLAFANKTDLDTHLIQLEEAKKRDHRKLGRELDLFSFSDLVGVGMPLFSPRGNIIREEIINFSRELNKELGFGEVHTPNINKAELFKISGHYDKYKEDMLSVTSQYVSDEMFMKPMNCPQHTQIFASQPRSYRDLPIRYSDFAVLYRDERPGEMSGLTRLRSFSQDDGHIFCREDQIESEISNVLNAIQKALKTYGIGYWMRLSLRDPNNKEKYLGDDLIWEKSQEIMQKLLEEKKITYKPAEGEAAFYGPKIDIMAVDAIGRTWQISTVQLDFNQPNRFKLEYTDKDGLKKTPVMIHRALIGSPDRFLGILIEHFSAALPVWLSPVQVSIVPVSENQNEYADTILKTLKDSGVRVDLYNENDSLGKRINSAKAKKVPYVIVVGGKEQEAGVITVETRGEKLQGIKLEDFVSRIEKEIKERTLN